MKLLTLTVLTPLRNEKQIIYKWTERVILLSPGQVESASFVEEIGKVNILLSSGRLLAVIHTLEEFAKMFNEATI